MLADNSNEMPGFISLKKRKKKTEFLYATVLFGALNVKHCRVCFSALFQNYWKNLSLKTILTKYWHTLIAYNTYRIRPNYRTVRLGFSKLLGTLRCDKICTYTY